ncbi:hypothetical protein ASY01nite_13820 [Acetobacter syzygii]|uniref:hypothetical protein n=1 Tax=Acetobacter syzygii TaxID=146476 RepID=UPI0005DDDDAD|nr:hypothetical protein [Acetobacter syzygii]GAN72096.1 hypothetical protein Absy_030_004 [Acetobacter syzygii]GBR64889.1 hypothetical protein AA0483_1585 [Acetobacter syzygii NRIC 0483]GEL56316.1 hypothetical protein ASY01nite_13820 [Acetobacter syzygii]
MSDSRPSVTIRMPSVLKGKIEERSKRQLRSLNAEIVYLLGFAIDEVDDWERHKDAQEVILPDDWLNTPPIEDMNELSADERSLVRMWRAMNDAERAALRAVAERLADKADSSGAA